MDGNKTDDGKLTWALMAGDIEEVRGKLVTKQDVNRTLESGRKPMHYAADYGHKEVMEFLIDQGAEIDATDKHGLTPLVCACYESHISCVKILLEKGADKHQKTPDGKSLQECSDSEAIKALFK